MKFFLFTVYRFLASNMETDDSNRFSLLYSVHPSKYSCNLKGPRPPQFAPHVINHAVILPCEMTLKSAGEKCGYTTPNQPFSRGKYKIKLFGNNQKQNCLTKHYLKKTYGRLEV